MAFLCDIKKNNRLYHHLDYQFVLRISPSKRTDDTAGFGIDGH